VAASKRRDELVVIAGIVLAIVAESWQLDRRAYSQPRRARRRTGADRRPDAHHEVHCGDLCGSGLVMGILKTNQHFLTPALAPSMNNVGLTHRAIVFAPRFGIYGLAAGAVLARCWHLGIPLPALRKYSRNFVVYG